MTAPMHDLVVYKGKMYFSHLRYLFEGAHWKPSHDTFGVVCTAAWDGYIPVFSVSKENPYFGPRWLLAFQPLESAPVLKLFTSRCHEAELHPQAVPDSLCGAPFPDTLVGVPFAERHGFKSAYCLEPLEPDCPLYDIGLILYDPKTRCSHLLEIGVVDDKTNHVVSFRKIHGPPRDPLGPKELKAYREALDKCLADPVAGREKFYDLLQKTWDPGIVRTYLGGGKLLPLDQFWAVVDDHSAKTGRDTMRSFLHLWQLNKAFNPLLGKFEFKSK